MNKELENVYLDTGDIALNENNKKRIVEIVWEILHNGDNNGFLFNSSAEMGALRVNGTKIIVNGTDTLNIVLLRLESDLRLFLCKSEEAVYAKHEEIKLSLTKIGYGVRDYETPDTKTLH